MVGFRARGSQSDGIFALGWSICCVRERERGGASGTFGETEKKVQVDAVD